MKQIGAAYINFSKSERSWVMPVILHLSFLVCAYFVYLLCWKLDPKKASDSHNHDDLDRNHSQCHQ